MIVTVTPTIMSGTVVRWFADDRHENGIQPAVSASRDAVRLGDSLHLVPPEALPEVLRAANEAHLALQADPDADLSHLATHRRKGLFGPLEPLRRLANPTPGDGYKEEWS